MYRHTPFFLGLLLAPALAHGQVYRCDGDNGVVVFSEHPCGDHAEEIMITPPTVTRSLSPDERRRARDPGQSDALRARQRRGQQEQAATLAEQERRNRLVRAIARREVIAGMRPIHVEQAWGRPDTVHRSNDAVGSRERWVYDNRRGRQGPSRVEFLDGRVVFARTRDGGRR